MSAGRAATVERIDLPPLRFEGKSIRVHTQGLEIVGGQYWVTARREDVSPRQALLLRTALNASGWAVWELPRPGPTFDHPGGLQSDGRRLWIPLAESRREGRSVIQAYPLAQLVPGRRPEPEVEFSVPDHVGALAVALDARRVVGASWDTATVYEWNANGRVQRRLSGTKLQALGLGIDRPRRDGLTVQDWKFLGDQLYASGLWAPADPKKSSSASRVMVFQNFPNSPAGSPFLLPAQPDAPELGREGMAVADGWVHFLPADLGETNHLYRFPRALLIGSPTIGP